MVIEVNGKGVGLEVLAEFGRKVRCRDYAMCVQNAMDRESVEREGEDVYETGPSSQDVYETAPSSPAMEETARTASEEAD